MALQQLFNFTNGGDSYIIYWNPGGSRETPGIQCFKNGVGIADDPAAPISHSEVGNISSYSFCDNTTLVEFEGIAAFPYAQKVETANAAECAIVVCRIRVNTPVKVSAETTAGANDGTATIEAETAFGSMEYSIDNGGTYQDSNIFTGLAAGSYEVLVRVKTETTCTARAIFEIRGGATSLNAYNPRFIFFFEGENQESFQVNINLKDYAGDPELIKAGSSPVVISWGKRETEKFKPVQPSTAKLQLLCEYSDQFAEFYSAKDLDYTVNIIKNEELFWQGFILSEQFVEPFKNPPFVVHINASCGLALLKNEEFINDPTNSRLLHKGRKPIIEVLSWILDRFSQQFNIIEGVNTYENSQNSTSTDSTFTQTYIDQENFIENEEKKEVNNCYEVVEKILQIFCARIYQHKGTWKIENFAEVKAPYNYRIFDYTGTLQNALLFDPVLTVNQSKISTGLPVAMVDNSVKLTGVKAYKRLLILRNVNKRSNLLLSGDFLNSDFEDQNTIKFWASSEEGIIEKSTTSEQTLLKIVGDGEGEFNAGYIESSFIDITQPSGVTNFVIGIKLSIQIQEELQEGDYNKFLYQVIIDDSGTLYYLQADKTFSTINNKVFIDVTEANNFIEIYNTFQVDHSSLNGNLFVRVFQAVGFSNSVESVLIEFVKLNVTGYSENLEEDLIYENEEGYSYTPPRVETFFRDAPSEVTGIGLEGKDFLTLSDASLTTSWSRSGATEALPILNALGQNIITAYKRPLKKIDGAILLRSTQGTAIEFNYENSLIIESIQEVKFQSIYQEHLLHRSIIKFQSVEIIEEEFLNSCQLLYPDGQILFSNIKSIQLLDLIDCEAYAAPSQYSFVIDTRNTSTGSSASDSFQLPLLSDGVYNFTVENWGDGSTDTITSWNQAETLHTYTTEGVYTVTISGTIEGFRFNNSGDKLKLLEVVSWGDLVIYGPGAFYGCSNLISTSLDVFGIDTTKDSDLSSTFRDCILYNQENIKNLNTFGVTSLNSFFRNCESFNQRIEFDLSTVLDVSNMFRDCTAFNSELDHLNFSNIILASFMLADCPVFNRDLGNIDVSNCTNISYMFLRCYAFNRDITRWRLKEDVNTDGLFSNATSFNQSIGSWNLKTSYLVSMLNAATSFNQDLTSWNMSLFNGAVALMANGTGLSTENLDKILHPVTGWLSTLPIFVTNKQLDLLCEPYTAGETGTGTATSSAVARLIDSGASFTSFVNVGDIVHAVTGNPLDYARVTFVNSDTELTLSKDIILSGETYSIQTSNSAKGIEQMINTNNITVRTSGYIN